MNENKDYEFVSAAMDDDGLSEEMLDKLLSDDGARQKWREYHIIRDCMQRTRPDVAGVQFASAENVRVVTAAETVAAAGGRQQRKAANQVFGGFAVAASVLAVAVGVWQFFPTAGQEGAAAVAEQTSGTDKGRSGIVSVGGKAKQGSTDAVANAEAQGAVVPNAARAGQNEAAENKAVRVEKMPQENGASGVK